MADEAVPQAAGPSAVTAGREALAAFRRGRGEAYRTGRDARRNGKGRGIIAGDCDVLRQAAADGCAPLPVPCDAPVWDAL
jgi:hypothetical protein